MQKYGKGAKYLIFSDVRLILRLSFAYPSLNLRSGYKVFGVSLAV